MSGQRSIDCTHSFSFTASAQSGSEKPNDHETIFYLQPAFGGGGILFCLTACGGDDKENGEAGGNGGGTGGENGGDTPREYVVGDLYDADGVKGIVFEVSGKHGKIISLEEKECYWSSRPDVQTRAWDEDDGMANMRKIKAIPNWRSEYQAFAWCDGMNTNGVTGWYLPAANELASLHAHYYEVADALEKHKCQWLRNEYYWTSTEAYGNDDYGCSAYFISQSRVVAFRKNESRYTRAIRAF